MRTHSQADNSQVETMNRTNRLRPSFCMAAAVASVAPLVAVGAEAFCGPRTTSSIANSCYHRDHHRRLLHTTRSQGIHRSSRSSLHTGNRRGGGVNSYSETQMSAVSTQDSGSRSSRMKLLWQSKRQAGQGRAGIRRPRAMAPLHAADQPSGPSSGAHGSEVARRASTTSLPPATASGEGAGLHQVEDMAQLSSGRQGTTPFGHITDETLDLIRASISITEVIGQHVEMKPAGRGMIGCCPFHEDRTPSFSVDDSRGSYHCFGCGARGDVITFLMQMEGLGFREAVRTLAEESGIPLSHEPAEGGSIRSSRSDTGDEKARKEARERLSLVLQMAAQFYTRCLVEMPAAGAARAHILERGISPVTVMDFQLGYSPADLTSPLVEYLVQEGFEMETLVDAGLVPDTSKWRYPTSPDNPRSRVDRFRGRLVMPIRDHRGTVIGFGARDLSDSQAKGSVGSGFVIPEPQKKPKRKSRGKNATKSTENEDEQDGTSVDTVVEGLSTSGSDIEVSGVGGAVGNEGRVGSRGYKAARPPAKYLNSPETCLFKKGRTVFGLDLAKETIRTEDMAVVVEGYFDVIKLHDAGIRCAVGVLGTAITADQLQLCARYSRNKRVVLCMDGDDAGHRAVGRLCESPSSSGLDSLTEAGVSISVASIPKDSGCKDPADFLQAHGTEAFRERVIGSAVPWSDWYSDRILAEYDFETDANAFRRCIDRLTGFVSDLSIPTDQTFYVHRFAKVLAAGNEAMQHQLEFDLTNMSKEKRARKNALRRRVGGGPAGGIGGSQSNPSADGQSRSEIPLLAPTQAPRQPPASPSTDLGAQNAVFIPGASLRRLAAGSAGAEDWNVADKDSPRLGAPGMPAVSTRTSSGASASRRNRKAANTKNFEEVNSNRPAMDAAVNGADMLRNHEWVIERVKLRKQEESRKKRERYGSKSKSAVWLPSVEQEALSLHEDLDDEGSGGTMQQDLLRERILDQAQRFLLSLAVHDPARRAKCAEAVLKHGLRLGNGRQQWLFNAVTSGSSIGDRDSPALPDVQNIGSGIRNGETPDLDEALVQPEGIAGGNKVGPVTLVEDGVAGGPVSQPQQPIWTPSLEALSVGGDKLYKEARAAAPPGYFRRGANMRLGSASPAVGQSTLTGSAQYEVADDGQEDEDTLDWVFDQKERERVAGGKNPDLVLLEVVMVIIKEQAVSEMHALTKELAEVSNDIARTMAEAAAASLLAGLSGSPTTVVDATVDEQEGTCGGARDSDSAAIAEAAASSSTVPVGRSREDAQLEVERLKARQLEIFTLIRDKREEIAELEAQRRSFTSRLSKVKTEARAFRKERELEARPSRSQGQMPQANVQSAPIETGSTLEEGSSRTGQPGELGILREEDGKSQMTADVNLDHIPMKFLDEDHDPDEVMGIHKPEGAIGEMPETYGGGETTISMATTPVSIPGAESSEAVISNQTPTLGQKYGRQGEELKDENSVPETFVPSRGISIETVPTSSQTRASDERNHEQQVLPQQETLSVAGTSSEASSVSASNSSPPSSRPTPSEVFVSDNSTARREAKPTIGPGAHRRILGDRHLSELPSPVPTASAFRRAKAGVSSFESAQAPDREQQAQRVAQAPSRRPIPPMRDRTEFSHTWSSRMRRNAGSGSRVEREEVLRVAEESQARTGILEEEDGAWSGDGGWWSQSP